MQPTAGRQDRRLKLLKRGQLFTRTHNEVLTVAMRVNNPDRSPVRINR
jgi:hypothetical protein